MLGVTEASILLDRPPGGWNELATKSDLAALETRIDRRFEEMDRRFAEMDRRFDGIDTTMELRIESAVNRAVASQTRWIFGALIALIPILAVINRL
jgi:hypothetical protein